eukprot:COSAG01_NODE_3437_length_6098_cov_5.799800_4_plen_165_part_00
MAGAATSHDLTGGHCLLLPLCPEHACTISSAHTCMPACVSWSYQRSARERQRALAHPLHAFPLGVDMMHTRQAVRILLCALDSARLRQRRQRLPSGSTLRVQCVHACPLRFGRVFAIALLQQLPFEVSRGSTSATNTFLLGDVQHDAELTMVQHRQMLGLSGNQ